MFLEGGIVQLLERVLWAEVAEWLRLWAEVWGWMGFWDFHRPGTGARAVCRYNRFDGTCGHKVVCSESDLL